MDETERQAKNRQLCELTGWIVEPLNGGWRVKSPEGHKTALRNATDLESAWDEARVSGYLSDFYGSLDACAAVLPEGYASGKGYTFTVVPHLAGGYVARITSDVPPMGIDARWEGRGTTRAEALADALLTWATGSAALESRIIHARPLDSPQL